MEQWREASTFHLLFLFLFKIPAFPSKSERLLTFTQFNDNHHHLLQNARCSGILSLLKNSAHAEWRSSF